MEMDVSFLQDCLYAEAAHYDTKPKQTLPLGYPSLSGNTIVAVNCYF